VADADELVLRMSRAARPTLFDAACEPGLLYALVLSDLLSPSLWTLAEGIVRGAHEGASPTDEAGDVQQRLMAAIQSYVNEHFFHLLPLDVEDAWGLVDLDAERRRLDPRRIDAALAVIAEEIASRKAHGEATERLDVIPLIARGTFPDYTYGTLDVLRAERAILARRKHQPVGISCCADEAVLIAALAVVLRGMAFDELVILGSVAHYTAFLRHRERSVWFNGKREFFFADGWRREAAAGGAQAAFDARLVSFDRILTPLGAWMIRERSCEVAPKRRSEIEDELAGFFGVRLAQLGAAPAPPMFTPPGSLGGISFAALDGADGAATVAARLRAIAAAHPGSLAEAAFYAYRDLGVRHPEAYAGAALRSHKSRQAAQPIGSFDDAVAIARAVPGERSIFGTRERVALPDEVLTLGTGSDRDKALLLHTLLRQAPTLAAAGAPEAEMLFAAEDSFVRAGARCISTRTWMECVPGPAQALRRIAPGGLGPQAGAASSSGPS
jgi:hypothetical protein